MSSLPRCLTYRLWMGLLVGLLLALIGLSESRADDPRIKVQADQVLHRVSPWLTGACIEDVNHEIYGGIYSQMIFGESFQEPADVPVPGFRALGGQWRAKDGELAFRGIAGDKLIADEPAFTDGEIGVEVFISDRRSWNSGLIVRVGRAGRGIDEFDGYEVSLDGAKQQVLLGRHRQNWEPIKVTPCEIPIGQWVPLVVRLEGKTIEILVGGKSITKHEDGDLALLQGTFGLRQFQDEARYRNLWYRVGEQKRTLPFSVSPEALYEVSGMWRPVRARTAQGAFQLDPDRPFVGAHSQRLTFVDSAGRIGIENRGLNRWGLHFIADKPYEVVVWTRCEQPQRLTASLETATGETLAAEALLCQVGDWQRQTLTLTPKATAHQARFALSLAEKGSVVIGYVQLQPGAWGRFQGLPVRRDVADALREQGVTVLRYGGSMINHPEYRWKKMIGPRDKRPPYHGTWYPHSTNGWGIIDFMAFCEAAGFAYVPAFHIDESPQDMADFIEYSKGAANSPWGQRRIADGHPNPFALKFIQIGNEERVDDAYYQKFQAIAAAIWQRDPEVILVVGDFLYGEPIRDPFQFRGAPSITSLAAHQKILRLAREHNREVWFDVHIDTTGPRPNFGGTISFVEQLARLAEGAKHRVVIFEFNSSNHDQRRALANAAAIQQITRDGRIPIALAANCLQPDGQNDNGWNQGLLFLNPSQVWLQPPGFVTQMYSRHYQPQAVRCEPVGLPEGVDVAATRSEDGTTLVLQVVNPTDNAVATSLELNGFVPRKETARVTELSGPLTARNSAEDPQAIVPRERPWNHERGERGWRYTFAPRSVTLIRME